MSLQVSTNAGNFCSEAFQPIMGFQQTQAGEIIWEGFRKLSELGSPVDKQLAIQYMVYMCGCPVAEVRLISPCHLFLYRLISCAAS